MRLALLVPRPLGATSGGYAYDRAMLDGLRAAGHAADAIELGGQHPLADAATCRGAAAAFDAIPADALPIIDGLALPAFREHAAALAARRTIGLIHHPTAFETSHSETDRALLHDAERALMPRLARVIVTSPSTAERLAAEFGVDARRIAVVAPGTAEAPRSAGSGGGACTVLSVGALIPRKGHDVLLEALAKLFDLDWQLTIVGSERRDPAHAARLHALATRLAIEGQVSFAGEIDPAALESLWQRTDIFALATYWEGYGMAIAEALKRGIPVAVTAGGAAGALVTPQSGVACTPGDVATLSKSLRRLIFDVDLRQSMAQAAWTEGQNLPAWAAQCEQFALALDSP
jgi:glycosyltransferase involved in cell wall biosynthesis